MLRAIETTLSHLHEQLDVVNDNSREDRTYQLALLAYTLQLAALRFGASDVDQQKADEAFEYLQAAAVGGGAWEPGFKYFILMFVFE